MFDDLVGVSLVVVLSGPSGVGKDTVLESLLQEDPTLRKVVTVTTRPCRYGEANGVDYHFVPVSRFEEMITGDELMEYAKVYGNWYGIPKDQVLAFVADGYDVVLRTDVQGAATIKRLIPSAITIFIAPDGLHELKDRMDKRGPTGSDDQKLRLKTACYELEEAKGFDYVVINRDGGLDEVVTFINGVLKQKRTVS